MKHVKSYSVETGLDVTFLFSTYLSFFNTFFISFENENIQGDCNEELILALTYFLMNVDRTVF